jgi:hypothetical protein
MWKSAGRASSREFYPGICLTTEEKDGKTSVRIRKIFQDKKNLGQDTVYILPKHPHTLTHTHTHTHTHIHTHTHTLQNNITPPQYKLKQTQCKICPNEIVTI